MTVRDFMVQRFNGRKWVVARRSPKMESKGYEVFLSQKAYRAITAHCSDAFK